VNARIAAKAFAVFHQSLEKAQVFLVKGDAVEIR
jgi:hypothetical protein